MFGQFEERPRKVHLYVDRTGQMYNTSGKPREYAHTLCKGNFASPELLTTNDPRKVTCKSCRKKMFDKMLEEHEMRRQDNNSRMEAMLAPPPPPEPFVVEAKVHEATRIVEHGIESFIFKFAAVSGNSKFNLETYYGGRFVLGRVYSITVGEKQ